MTRITLDAEMRKRLGDLQQPIELCDETGRVVGHVFPARDLSEYDLTEPPLDMDEVRRQLNEEPRYTTKQVLEHLENL